MKKFDDNKTRKLVASSATSEDGIELIPAEVIGKLLRDNVVECRLYSSRGKGSMSVPAQAWMEDLDSKEKNTKEFINDYVDAGHISFFPKEVNKRIHSIQNGLRTKLKRLSASKAGKGFYLTKDNYLEFKKDYLQARDNFFAERDWILKNHTHLKEIFKNKMEKAFKDLGTEDADKTQAREKMVEYIVANFPTKEMIKKNFAMELITTQYPAMDVASEAMDEVDKEVFEDSLQGWKDNAVEVFHGLIGTLLNKAFLNVASVQKTLAKNDKLPSKTKGGLTKVIKIIENDNDRLKIEELGDIQKVIKKAFVDELSFKNDGEIIDKSEMIEMAEILLGYIYSYAEYLSVEEFIEVSQTEYEADELADIGFMYENLKPFLK